MSEACRALHEIANARERHRFPFDDTAIPENGIYVLFEEGETAHGGRRIVRTGSHRGHDQLRGRLHEHFLRSNKDRSIFRKNIGRALLNGAEDPFLEAWNLDLTSRKNRERYEGEVDLDRQAEVEREVTERIRSRFSFAVFEVTDRDERLELERRMIGTVARCRECGPSADWFGLESPKRKIRESGLWQEQDLSHEPLTLNELEELRPGSGDAAESDVLEELIEEIVRFRDEREWAQFHTPRNLAMALSVEAGELLERFLWLQNEGGAEEDGIAEEVADVLIYALLLCHSQGIDPAEAIRAKLTRNEEKYPVELARGKATKWDRL